MMETATGARSVSRLLLRSSGMDCEHPGDSSHHGGSVAKRVETTFR